MIPFRDDINPLAFSPFEWPEYNYTLLFPPILKPQTVGVAPQGVLRSIGPLVIEEYLSDREPDLTLSDPKKRARSRLVVWYPLTRTDVPAGWHRMPFMRSSVEIGFHLLEPEYYRRWNKTARYYRTRYFREDQTKYKVVPLTYDEFAKAFAESTVAKEIPTFELNKLQSRLAQFPEHVHMWGTQRAEDNKIVAGINVFDAPSCRASHYGCGFYLAEVRKDNLMVVLMDHWFQYALAHNFSILHLGTFLNNPRARSRAHKISRFKSQFATHYHTYQPPLFRLARGKRIHLSII